MRVVRLGLAIAATALFASRGCGRADTPPPAMREPAHLGPDAASATRDASTAPEAEAGGGRGPSASASASASPSATAPELEEADCDPGGPAPRACVPAAETRGEPIQGGCRVDPGRDVCRACRPVFVERKGGLCCYEGLSRLPRCRSVRPR